MKKNTTILILAIFAACSFVNTDLFAQKNKQQKEKIVEIITEMGTIKVKLYNETPLHRDNFLKLAENGEMNGSTFHRVISGFMIQGGGFDKNMMQKKTNSPIKNESNNRLKNKKYTIAMARTNDPDSATSQFFINLIDNDFLNYSGNSASKRGYCVFGTVIEGKQVVDKIGTYSTHIKNGMGDVPIKTVVIKSIK